MKSDSLTKDQRALVLDQLEGQWQKIAAVLVWKLGRDLPVIVTAKDFADIQAESNAGKVFMTWGHYDSFEFRWMVKSAAEKLADHVERKGGVRS